MVKIIIFVVIMFEILIMTHEFGHFYTARKTGVVVEEFAVGMGPALIKKEKNGTVYSLRIFPIGGFVSMEGETETTITPGSFGARSTGQKLLIISGGAIMNFLTGVIIVFVMYSMIGTPTNIVDSVTENEPAWAAGIQSGDAIVSVNGVETSGWKDLKKEINSLKGGTTAVIGIERDGEKTPVYYDVNVDETDEGVAFIGITPESRFNLIQTVKNTAIGTVNLVYVMYKSIEMLITGEASVKEVVGPVGVVSVFNSVADQGIYYIMYLTALISVNLAVVNMLPFPALDGGHFVFIVLDAVLKNGVNQKFRNAANYTGLVLLMVLMVVITLKDIKQFIL